MAYSFSVGLVLCEEAGVLVATSDDIPGLVLEAETFGGIMDALIDCAPELIGRNHPDLPEDAYCVSFGPVRHPFLCSCTATLALAS